MNANAPTAPIATPGETSEFAGELLERRQRRRIPKTTLVLACLVVIGAVFVAGIEAQKSLGSSSTAGASGSAGRAGGFPSGFPAFARGGAAAGGSSSQSGASSGGGGAPGVGGFNATSGTVTLIKGSTLYVTDSSGNTVLVKTSGTAAVTKTIAAKVSSIRPGDTVSFVGTQKSDGSFAPRAISVTSASGG